LWRRPVRVGNPRSDGSKFLRRRERGFEDDGEERNKGRWNGGEDEAAKAIRY